MILCTAGCIFLKFDGYRPIRGRGNLTPPKNSFEVPIQSNWSALCALEWEFPYIHIAVAGLAILIVLAVLAVLYPTVGVFLQVTSMLAGVTEEANRRLKDAQSFERIGQATAVGVLFLIYLPFAVIGWPLYFLATLAQKAFDALSKLLDGIPGPRS